MRIHEFIGMPVVALDDGVRLGTVRGVELDMSAGGIRYVRIRGEGRRGESVVPWSALHSVGRDAVTIESSSALLETIPGADRDSVIPHLGDRPVVTESGDRIGRLDDYEFDPQTGAILTYHLAPQGLLGRITGHRLQFPHASVRTVGADAIIVSDDVLPAEAA
jgi:uncharacterized protein YrrD